MPLYSYRCVGPCHAPRERRVAVALRDDQTCHECGSALVRNYASPHLAAIAGIPNRIGDEIEAGSRRHS